VIILSQLGSGIEDFYKVPPRILLSVFLLVVTLFFAIKRFNPAQFTTFSVMLLISQGTILFLPAFVLFGLRALPSFRQFQPRLRIAATLFSWLALIISLFSDTWSGVFTVLAAVVSATLVSLE
jgi:phosphoglycerol transferase MdoB-like AlkP superfamily enzyme